MKTIPSFLLAIIFAIGSPARAALGLDLQQCKARYGEVTKTLLADAPNGISKIYIFQKGNLEIRVRFLKGKAAYIKYEAGVLMDESQRNQLLEASKGESKWVLKRTELNEIEKELYKKVWLYDSEDKTMQAHITQADYPSTEVTIYTKAAGDLLKVFRTK